MPHQFRPGPSVTALAAVVAAQFVEWLWRREFAVPLPLSLAWGMSVAMLLALGIRALPGIVLAALLSPLWRGSGDIAHGLGAAAVELALTWLALKLLVGRRPRPPRLGTPRQLARFVLVCGIAAMLRVLPDALAGVPVERLAQAWAAHASGLLIVPPVMMSWFAEPRGDWAPRRLLLGTLLPSVVSVIALGLVHYSHLLHEQDAVRFRRLAEDRGGELSARIQAALDALLTLRSLHAVAPGMTRDDFADAVREWSGRSELHAVGIAVHVEDDEVAAFEQMLRSDGAPEPSLRSAIGDGGFRPLQQGETIVAIRHIEPWERNAQVLGSNSYANPRIREAVDRAWRTGAPAATASFPLRVARGHGGAAGALPSGIVIYQSVPSRDGGRARPGLAFVTLRVDQIAGPLLEGLQAGVTLCLADEYGGATAVLAERPAGACAGLRAGGSTLGFVREIGGRQWRLLLGRTGAAAPQQVGTAAAVAMVPAALLGLLFLSMTGQARLVRRAAARARAAQQAAEAANRAKSEFLARMSHELRAPLNGIIGYAQLAKASKGDPAVPVERWAPQIERAGWHLRDLIDDLLDTSRLDAGAVEVRDDVLPLQATLQEALGMVEPLAQARGLALNADAAVEPRWRVHGDARRIRQSLINVLSNAIKYNRAGGEVHLAVEAGERMMVLRIRDTGLGMSPAQLRQLFSPFERLGREATQIEGTGLGMFVTRRLVELMGGSIEVESRENEGSSFVISLRRAPDESGADVPPGAAVRTVLAFEDDPVATELLTELMRVRPQVRLVVRPHGADALDAVRSVRPSLILLDRHLPGGDGLAILRALQQDPELAAVPVVLTSGGMVDELPEAIAGVRAVCPKPWNLRELGASVDSLLRQIRH